MGFDDWVSEQERARHDSANTRAAEDQVRYANAARVVDALTAELRTVVPRLRAFPAVTVQEHRVDITASVTGATVTVPNWRRDYQAPEGDFSTRMMPVGQPRTAWSFKDMWLDEDGHLWFEVGVIADAGLWQRNNLAVETSGGGRVLVPLRSRDVERWVAAEGRGAAEVTVNGQAWSTNGWSGSIAGKAISVRTSFSRRPEFLGGSKWSSSSADLRRGDPSEMYVGFSNYDAPATVARDFIFESVQIALQQGRHTL